MYPPESCAVILEAFDRDPTRGPDAAEALRLSAQRTLELGAVDEVIPEPLGGAHRDPAGSARTVKAAILQALGRLRDVPRDELAAARYRKYRAIDHYVE